MSFFDWSKAPEWATCVVEYAFTSTGYYWCEGHDYCAKMQDTKSGLPTIMTNPTLWKVIEKRPVALVMTEKAKQLEYENFKQAGWSDEELIREGYAFTTNEVSNCRCAFTPAQQPSTAPDLLNQAAKLLAERGQQYDKSGNERSAAKIVAALNAATGRDLTPGEGWLFLVMLKAVRFYSNTETPHRDSLEDMIAYAALHAEEYLNGK